MLNDRETFAQRQARVRAATEAEEKADAERQARARANFDALGEEIAKATTRAELLELGRKRADLAPYTGVSYVYTSHCWNCKKTYLVSHTCPVSRLRVLHL
jgi:hypothetical protein